MSDALFQSLMQALQQAPSDKGSLWEGINGNPGLMEALARAVSNGRDQGQRAFYNDTRAGLNNSAAAPAVGFTYGGAGNDLNTRRALQGYDAMDISRAVRPDLRGD